MAFDTFPQPTALRYAKVQWEQLGPAAIALPNGLWTPVGSDGFFNGGRRNWALVEKNKPVDQASWASASPAGAAPTPTSTALKQEYSVTVKNLLGVTVIAIRYGFTVQTARGAAPPDQWISRLIVSPGTVDIAYGWNVGMTVVVQEPREYDSAGAAIAVLPVTIELAIDTKLKHSEESKLYLVTPVGVFSTREPEQRGN